MNCIQNTTLSCGVLSAPVKIYSVAGEEPELQLTFCGPNGEQVERVYIEKETEDDKTYTADGLKRIVRVFDQRELGRAYNEFRIGDVALRQATEESLIDDEGNSLKEIMVEHFVSVKDLPSERNCKVYWIGPDKKVSTKAFEIFKAGLKRKKVAAIAKVVMRSRQKLLAIYVKDDILHAQVLNFVGTMDARDDDVLRSNTKPKKDEVAAMGQLIDVLMAETDVLDMMEDTYVTRKRELVENTIKGKGAEPPQAKAKTDGRDLMDVLKESVTVARKRKRTTKR